MRWRYDTDKMPSRWRNAWRAAEEKGFVYVARLALLWATFPVWGSYLRIFPRSFRYRSVPYRYFLHGYNLTWSNERAIEIPIVLAELARQRGKRVLEVGNVLSHYAAVDHPVIDKFEKGAAILNEDVVSFRSAERYDLIVSVSTLEHVGWDEDPQDTEKIGQAVANLIEHLAPGGRLLVTLPLGYNPPLDAQLAAGSLPFDCCDYFKRRGLLSWEQVNPEALGSAEYAGKWPGADTLVIAVVER